MFQLSIIFTLLLFCLRGSHAHSNNNDAAYILTSVRVPADADFLPTLGNGHLGYTVFGDAIYMSGVYNGHGGNSRRARLPNWLNVSVSSIKYAGRELSLAPRNSSYELLLEDGYFRWCSEYAGDGVNLKLEQRTYPHRYHDRALVYELRIRSEVTEAPLTLMLEQFAGAPSDAFHFTTLHTSNTDFKLMRGTTRIAEHEQFQTKRRQVFLVFSDDLEQGKSFELGVGVKEFYYRYIITADVTLATALREMEKVLTLTPQELFDSHTAVWRKFWQNFNIEVQGNLELSQTINAGIFYLANSLPTPAAATQHTRPHYGLSPTGLGRGQLDSDYEGHSFWDTEIWMLPAVTQFDIAWAETLLQYRLEHLNGAQYNANVTGYRGARFPWESAYTGTEVTNPCCPEVAALQIHISPDIVFALRQHYAVTHDNKWLCATAWPITKEVAEFLVSRVTYNQSSQEYHIVDVMGPDEDHLHVTDNVYTNVVFKYALEFGSFVRQKCAPEDHSPDLWLNIAERIFILYNETLDYHPQHLGYQRGEVIKQADVILLGYPLQFDMKTSTRFNDLNTYAEVTRESGPAMTWSMFAINFLDLAEVDKANMYFVRGYKDYIRPEFKVWSENKIGFAGSVNFITGIGGFLQAIINGYAGIRFNLIDGKSEMIIRRSHLLPSTEGFTIRGIKFAGAEFALSVNSQGIATINCLSTGQMLLDFTKGKLKYRIFKGFTAVLNTETALVRTL